MSLRVARRKPINAECTSYIEKGYSVIHKGLYVKGRVFDKNKLPFLLHIFSFFHFLTSSNTGPKHHFAKEGKIS